MFRRSSGILMHISSLPSKYGIGDFGKSAYDFINFLEKSGQKNWQILPLGATGYGDSPYQSFSAFSGNPYFIDLESLVSDGYLEFSDLNYLENKNPSLVDYNEVYHKKYFIFKKAYSKFVEIGDFIQLKEFRKKNLYWIEDYSLFMALKEKFNGASWLNWPRKYRVRDRETMKKSKIELKKSIQYFTFLEYLFQNHWFKLKSYANKKGIKIIGDIPMFVSTDSSDTWATPNFFQFDKYKKPKRVAGCPPDFFSKSGQLWGNVLYDWKAMEEKKYVWWINRLKFCSKLYDISRIDHFRGFESYWSIPAEAKSAAVGRWEKGPGMKFFNIIKSKLGNIPIIAEDLGILTSKVEKLLIDTGYPGMKILEFAFDSSGESSYLPHKYKRNSIAYTGTHDNNTIVGWYKEAPKKDKEFCNEYLKCYLRKIDGDLNESISWKCIEAIWGSKSVISIAQLQDFLEIGNIGRMNTPSTLGGNWTWRVSKEELTDELASKILKITKKFNR
ncbi:4-alpha-glucanotransferase [Cetobacterium sp. 2A]|uniref:4-alpha-glucanotransferase n=1 Tax=Cetobacterium sp. 2A TaxID=2754723 RepID=UPI00163C5F29|nr:4-alpha-glucanotransferase [Cetobacterium sp. 2A]MBC2855042.1 4-alpha-glucanotransferase [Cetobacterium sp. 2A]